MAPVPEQSQERLRAMFEDLHARLHERARALMLAERASHTLEPSALVSEVFLRLAHSERVEWRDRRHFEQMAGKVMRQVLVDHAKGRARRKRGHGAARITLSEDLLGAREQRVVDLLALDELLTRLAERDARAAEVLQLRVFSGMTVREVAAALRISYDVAKDEWLHARAWLLRELSP